MLASDHTIFHSIESTATRTHLIRPTPGTRLSLANKCVLYVCNPRPALALPLSLPYPTVALSYRCPILAFMSKRGLGLIAFTPCPTLNTAWLTKTEAVEGLMEHVTGFDSPT